MKAALVVTAVLAFAAPVVQADVFSMGGTRDSATGVWTGSASLEFVPVGDAGNAPDTRYSTPGYGQVNYNYKIGKYDVTSAQYCAFLNSVASTDDPYGLYNANMATAPVPFRQSSGQVQSGNPGQVGCGIVRTSTGSGYSYSVTPGKENMPVNWVSWGDCLRFCNWLSNGQQGPGTTETGSYTLNGTNYGNISRNSNATYVLPSQDEWYKAAYYKGGTSNTYWTYTTRSDSLPSNVLSATGTNNANYLTTSQHYLPPWTNDYYSDPQNYLTPVGYFAGSPGAYGTFDMGGNLAQFLETSFPGDPTAALTRGGLFDGVGTYLQAGTFGGRWRMDEFSDFGFRLSLVPEPCTSSLVCVSALSLLRVRRPPRSRHLLRCPGAC